MERGISLEDVRRARAINEAVGKAAIEHNIEPVVRFVRAMGGRVDDIPAGRSLEAAVWSVGWNTLTAVCDGDSSALEKYLSEAKNAGLLVE